MGKIKEILYLTMAGVFAVATYCGAEEIETNAFGYPLNKPIMVIDNTADAPAKNLSQNTLPECSDPRLVDAIRQNITPVVTQSNPNIIEERNTALLLKNVANFKEVAATELSPQKYRAAAARVVELKINNHLTNDEIRVCLSQSPEIKDDIYAVIYRQQEGVLVTVLTNSKKLSDFVFSNK